VGRITTKSSYVCNRILHYEESMTYLKEIEIKMLPGAWIIVEKDKPQVYTQHPQVKDYLRLIKDLLKHLDLQNLVEIKER